MLLKTKGQKDWCFGSGLLSIFSLMAGMDSTYKSYKCLNRLHDSA